MLRRLAFALLLITCSCSRAGAPIALQTKTLTFALAADPSNLNPLFIHPDAASVEQQVARLSFLPFVDLNAHGHPIPVLLRELPTRRNGGISADGRTITYHLRRRARWSDGAPLTSADVLWTLHAILDPRNPVRSHAGYDLIDRADAPDAHTVIVHLRRAWAPAALSFFSYGTTPQVVLPAHILRTQTPLARAPFNAAPYIGDGPYRFVAWRRGDRLVFVANSRFWGKMPQIGRLVLRIVPDPQTNLTLLRSGSLAWNLIAPAQRVVVAKSRGIAFVQVPTTVVAGLAFNTARGPLRDVRLRRAIAMSVDRNAISQKIADGVYPVTNMLQPQFSWAYNPKIREPGFDPAKADALLDASGWRRGSDGIREKNGRKLRLLYVQFPESTTGVRVATFVQAELHDRGIAVSIKSVSNAQLFLPVTGVLATGNFDLAYVPWTLGADPDDSAVLTCKAPENYMQWCNPRVDQLEARAVVSSSRRLRRKLYAEIGHIVARRVPILYLFNADYLYAYRTQLHGFAPNPIFPTWNAADWHISASPKESQ